MAANLGACYIVMLKNSESPLKLFGRQLSLAKQYLFVMIASVPLFYLAGAGSAVFWVYLRFIFTDFLKINFVFLYALIFLFFSSIRNPFSLIQII
jgi:hypothetical protein